MQASFRTMSIVAGANKVYVAFSSDGAKCGEQDKL